MVKALQFHRITPRFQFCGTWNYPDQFEGFLRFLTDNCDLVLPGQKASGIVITFDDGDVSIYDHAFPILKKYGVRPIVFLIVDYINRDDMWDITLTGRRSSHLSWDQIHEMRDWGVRFGSHTMSHHNLTKLGTRELKRELFESKSVLEAKLGPVDCISYPFNRVNNEVLLHARHAGYKYGFGGDGSSDLLIKKEAIYITDNRCSLGIKLSERPGLLYRYDRLKQQVINYFTITTMLTRRSCRG